MTHQGFVRVACVVLFLFAGSPVATPTAAVPQSRASGTAASAAAKANPELIGALSKELGSTPEQAAGAAGALFGLAKTRLKGEEFAQIGQAVPGVDLLLKAAPAAGGGGAAGALGQFAGSAGGLATVGGAFSKLGLKPELVAKAVPVLVGYVTKSGGANLGSLLGGVLK